MLASLYIALYAAVIAFAISDILSGNGMILSPFKSWAESNLRRWLYMPLIGCSKCMTGQIALWGYLVNKWGNYSPIDHLFSICLSVLIVSFIDKLYYR